MHAATGCRKSVLVSVAQDCLRNYRTKSGSLLGWFYLYLRFCSVSTRLYCSWSKSCNWFLRMWEPRMIDFKREKIHLSGALCWDKGLKSNSLIEENAEIREQRMWSSIQWQNLNRNPFGWDVLPCLRCSDCVFCPSSCFLLYTPPHTPFFNCCGWITVGCSSNLRQPLLLKINHWTWLENI